MVTFSTVSATRLGWAGPDNLYWIDRTNKIGGHRATQIHPFADATSFDGCLEFGTAAYRALHG